MDISQFYIDWYNHELTRRSEITRLLTIPVTLLIASGTVYGFLIAFISASVNRYFVLVLLLLMLISTVFFVRAVLLLSYTFLLNEKYYLLTNSRQFLESHRERNLIDNETLLSDHQLQDLASGIDENKIINDKRELNIAEFYLKIRMVYFLFALCFILYLIWFVGDFFSHVQS